eukprot:scaffold62029_cov65-Attheya_sp.AAC.4
MKPAWFSRPMSVSNGPWHAREAASKSVMLRDHAMYLCIGRDINRLRELISHPNTGLISAGVASAKNFFSERTSSRDMDSSWCNGRPRRWITKGRIELPRSPELARKAMNWSLMKFSALGASSHGSWTNNGSAWANGTEAGSCSLAPLRRG